MKKYKYSEVKKVINYLRELNIKMSLDSWSKHSLYLGFSRMNNGWGLFTIRFSDHELSYNNKLPAGVINVSAEFRPLNVELIKSYLEDYNGLTEREKEELWENRSMVDEVIKLYGEKYYLESISN